MTDVYIIDDGQFLLQLAILSL